MDVKKSEQMCMVDDRSNEKQNLVNNKTIGSLYLKMI